MTFIDDAKAQKLPVQKPKPRVQRKLSSATPMFVTDDLAWAMTQRLSELFRKAELPLDKNDAWIYARVEDAIKNADVHGAYARHPDRFTDKDGKDIPLAEFGPKIANYLWKNVPWQDECHSSTEAFFMLTDPVRIKSAVKGLWRYYSDKRLMKGHN